MTVFPATCTPWEGFDEDIKDDVFLIHVRIKLQLEHSSLREYKWLYDGIGIEIVQNFNYLGIVFSSSLVQATNTLSGKGLKAMNSLLYITKELDISI
jgi:hypothetical protein